MQLMEFLSRLDSENLGYRLTRARDGVTVVVNGFCEFWEVTFGEDDGEVEEVIVYDARPPEREPKLAISLLFDRCKKTWEEAAADLGIEFISPFGMIGETGASYECAGLLPNFGSAKGTLIISHKDDSEIGEIGSLAGYYCSGLSPFIYYRYDRSVFIETLSDWGWFGDKGKRPAWMASKDS